MKTKAFTLVEVLIVVAILGILAAIIVPQYSHSAILAREAAAKDILQTMRGQIEFYKMQHNGVAPGYMGAMQAPLSILANQFVGTSAINGAAAGSKVPSYPYVYGPYVNKLPVNPFNDLATFTYVPAGVEFEDAADGDDGWLYNKETGDIRLNQTGEDSHGVNYCEY